MWEEALKTIAIVIGAGGAGSLMTILARYLLNRTKLGQSHSLEVDQRDFDHATTIIARQERRINNLERMHVEALEKHEECLKQNAEIREELGRLKESVGKLEQVRLIASVVVDGNGTIVDWDAGAAEIFHWSREEAIGRSIVLITPHRYRDAHFAAFENVVKNKRHVRTDPLDVLGITREGHEIPITVFLSDVWDEKGGVRIGAQIRSR